MVRMNARRTSTFRFKENMKPKLNTCDICGKEFKTHPIHGSHRVCSLPNEGRTINDGHKLIPVCFECYDKHFALSQQKINTMIQNIDFDIEDRVNSWKKEDPIKNKGLMP